MSGQWSRSKTLLVIFLGVIALATPWFVKPRFQIRYNVSHSAPLGWYAIVPERDVPVGAFVLARMPNVATALADQRGYLPKTVPILKRVAATHGQNICSRGNSITVDGVVIARALPQDSAGRPLERWTGCRRLADDELLLLNPDSAASFDSRYFGPIRSAAVIGKAIPLWTW